MFASGEIDSELQMEAAALSPPTAAAGGNDATAVVVAAATGSGDAGTSSSSSGGAGGEQSASSSLDATTEKPIRLRDVPTASGFCIMGASRGCVVMSNIFLSTALTYLASEEVGCLELDPYTQKYKPDETCSESVYGLFAPAALITNIGAAVGIISAIIMPICGAIVDFTPHRWTVGVVSSAIIVIIQAAQIWTNSDTWFYMAMLQALWGVSYHIMTMASYAYLPDMTREIPETTMAHFTSLFTMTQFGCQTIFLVVVSAISHFEKMDDVQTAQMSQAIAAVTIGVPFYIGWKLLPTVGAQNRLDKDRSFICQVFAQNLKTTREINRDYRRSLKWFLLGTAFSEPGAGAFTVVAVVFFNDHLGMRSSQIGFGFLLCLVAMIPGGLISTSVANRTDANTAVRIFCFFIFLLCVVGAAIMTPQNVNPVAYTWLFFLGLGLGAYYPSLKLFLSFVVPKSREAEIIGFFVNSCHLLSFLPPLIFSILVEAGADQSIGLISIGIFFLIAVNFFSMAAPFDELLAEVRSMEKKDTDQKLLDDKDKSDHQDDPKKLEDDEDDKTEADMSVTEGGLT